jgi:hypothetical protein
VHFGGAGNRSKKELRIRSRYGVTVERLSPRTLIENAMEITVTSTKP